jgi:signal transduction histidine kinase
MRFEDLTPLDEAETWGNSAGFVAGENRARNLEIILNVTKMINHSLILDEVLGLVLNQAIRVARAERGFLLLADEHAVLQCVISCNAVGKPLDAANATISRTVVDDVYATGESVCVENAQLDDLYDRRESVRSLELETILCSPLTVRDEKIGVLYVDSRHIQPVHRDEIVNLFEILAGQAAIAIKNAQLYERVRKAFADLESANERVIVFERLATKGEIAAEVSHELNNLLTVLTFQLSAFKKEFSSLTQVEADAELTQINDAVKNLAVFSKGLAEAAHLHAKKQFGNLNEAIADTIGFVQPLAKFKKASIATILDPAIPEILFDSQQMQQLILNLLNNAAEAHPHAQIVVQTSLRPDTRAVRISVKDDGPGISKEVMEKLFKEKVTTKVTGHGYGLPICKKLVENLDGTIDVVSSLGSGTEFVVVVPIVTS